MNTTLYPGIPFSPQTTITNNIGAADSIIGVSDVSAFPPAPNLATIGTDEEGETILYTAKTETALSGCQRGVEGEAKGWAAGALIGRNFTAKDHADLIAAVTEAYGAAEAAQEAAGSAMDVAQTAQEAAATAGAIAAAKQPKLTGQPGQVVGFDADGAAVAQDASDLADAVTVPGGGVMELGPGLGEGPYTFELEEDGATEVSAAQVSYDGTQSGLQAETVQGAVDELGAGMARVSNKNLLHNWYWADPANQRKQLAYTKAGYAIDRWRTDGGVTVENDFITLSPSIAIFQNFENQEIFFGSTVTISALTADGQLVTSTGVLPQSRPSVNTNYIPTNTNGIMVYMRISAENQQGGAYVAFYLGNGRSTPVNMLAAKVELGPVQTLAHKVGDTWVLNDPPPDKALELLKCQRYYQVFATQSMRPTKAEDFRPPMRVNPALGTIVIDGVTYYTADANL